MCCSEQSEKDSSTDYAELIDIDMFRRIDLRVGLIKHADRVPNSKKLIKLIVNIGSEEKQLVAGLAEWYKPEDLINKFVIVVVNLKPKKFMGIESQGMLLATCDKGKPVILTVAEPVEPGSKIC